MKKVPGTFLSPFLSPKYGGHVGFVLKRKDGFYYSELRAIDFFKKKIKLNFE